MTDPIDACSWTEAALAASLPFLIRGHGGASTVARNAEINGDADSSFEEMVAPTLAAVGVGMRAMACRREHIGQCLMDAAPMVVRIPRADGQAPAALFVAKANRRAAVVIGPDGRRERIRLDLLARLLGGAGVESSEGMSVLHRELGRRAGQRIIDALRRQEFGSGSPLFLGWTLETERPAASTKGVLIRASLPLVFTHLLQFSLWIGSWVALVVLLSSPGAPDSLTLVWIAALTSALVLLPVETALEHGLSGRIGIAVKRWLLADALSADRKYVGALGLGQLIARSLESHHLDALAARGGIRFTLAVLDATVIVVAYGAFVGIDALVVLFAAVVAWGAHRGRVYYRRAVAFLNHNLDVTGVHTEQLVGHRTRKAFMRVEDWNLEEDHSIARYHESARQFDDAFLGIALIPRVWVVVALFVVLMTLFGNDAGVIGVSSVAMIGFVIATFAALQSAALGASEAIRAWVSFARLDTLARDPDEASVPKAPIQAQESGGVVCRGLSYSYPRASTPAVANVDLSLAPGSRVLLTGRSGSGKSTLAAVVAGRLQQDSGIVLSDGLDRHIVGMARWRSLICYVPQQGANHVLTETFAFNLLLGRPWPPTRQDMADALQVASDLGLDSLIDRMPAGMMQMIGEGGWSLSQGEKARLFVARGILQRARLLIADEVLSPLDAKTAMRTLDAMDRHCNCLMLIAHA